MEGKENNRIKQARREMITKLVLSEHISTQMELLRRLEEEGFRVTQATVSRDIRELKLVKIADGNGMYHYEMSQPPEKKQPSGQFISLFRSAATSVDSAQNLVVIHTYSGMASAVCATMDGIEWEGVLGTVAGDDTILVVTRTEKTARELVRTLREFSGK